LAKTQRVSDGEKEQKNSGDLVEERGFHGLDSGTQRYGRRLVAELCRHRAVFGQSVKSLPAYEILTWHL